MSPVKKCPYVQDERTHDGNWYVERRHESGTAYDCGSYTPHFRTRREALEWAEAEQAQNDRDREGAEAMTWAYKQAEAAGMTVEEWLDAPRTESRAK